MRVTLESDPVPFYIHFTLLILHTSSHACLLRSQPNIALIKNGLNYMNYQCKILGFYIWSFLSVIVQDSLAFLLHSFCSILKSFDFNLDVFTKIKILSKGLRKFERWKDVGLKKTVELKVVVSIFRSDRDQKIEMSYCLISYWTFST